MSEQAHAKAYALRNKTTGEFAVGGSSAQFAKIGKLWPTAGRLKAHLTLYNPDLPFHREYLDTVEVVELELVPVKRMTVEEFDKP